MNSPINSTLDGGSATIKLITCTKCKHQLAPSRFHKHQRDGYSQPCKDCKKAAASKTREARKKSGKSEADKEARRKWKKTPAGIASQRRSFSVYGQSEHGKTKKRDWLAAHPEQHREHYTRWNRKQQHLRRLTKAFAIIAQEALQNGFSGIDE